MRIALLLALATGCSPRVETCDPLAVWKEFGANRVAAEKRYLGRVFRFDWWVTVREVRAGENNDKFCVLIEPRGDRVFGYVWLEPGESERLEALHPKAIYKVSPTARLRDHTVGDDGRPLGFEKGTLDPAIPR